MHRPSIQLPASSLRLLSDARLYLGYSFDEVAQALHLETGHVMGLETGVHLYSEEILVKTCGLYGLDPEDAKRGELSFPVAELDDGKVTENDASELQRFRYFLRNDVDSGTT